MFYLVRVGKDSQRSRAQNQFTTLVTESECSHLDTALRSVDEPVLGLSVRSTQRPVLQTLALALALHWGPLDPRDLLAFLIHPVSPMNDVFRAKLAKAVAERPGVGGAEWNQAIKGHRDYLAQEYRLRRQRFAKGSETGRRQFNRMDRGSPASMRK